jgi:hypothetical protein
MESHKFAVFVWLAECRQLREQELQAFDPLKYSSSILYRQQVDTLRYEHLLVWCLLSMRYSLSDRSE